MPVKKKERRANTLIFGVVLTLMIVGLISVSSASAVLSFNRFGYNNYYFFRQILFAALSLVFMYIFSKIDYRVFRKWARPIMLAGIIFLGLVLVPGIGTRAGSAQSWFSIGSFLLQPSEFVKLALIFYLASWFERKKGAEQNFWFGIIPPLLVIGLTSALIIVQPDIGGAAMMVLIAFVIFFAAGAKIKYLSGLFVAGLVGLWLLVKAAPYRAARIVTFLDPSLDPRGIGYHINQALLAIGSGGLWGYGYGDSRQKHNFLPETIGDSIFAVMAEELGFVRILIIITLFIVLIISGLRLANTAPDKFGELAAIGIVGWIGAQALVNIGAISGLLPLTGVTLPFISYGGSSLLALGIAVGILLNISKQRL